jgi:hypothetical protein
VLALSHDPNDPQVPITLETLGVEPDVVGRAADPLSRSDLGSRALRMESVPVAETIKPHGPTPDLLQLENSCSDPGIFRKR